VSSETQLGQVSAQGFVSLSGVKILSSIEKQVAEKLMDNAKAVDLNRSPIRSGMTDLEGEVLGDSTSSAKVALTFKGSSATASAELLKTIAVEQQASATVSSGMAVLEIKKQGGHEVLISTAFVKALDLKKDEIVGNKITLEYIITGSVLPIGLSGRVLTKPLEYTIVGVFKEDSKPMLITPLSDLSSIGVSRYNTVKILANKPENLTVVRERIQLMGFTTSSIVDTLAQVERLFRIMRFVLGAFGVIALVVALFGMFNTLTISLMERTRELGVMKTLGTTDGDVFRLFMAESLIIGAVGGVLGIVIGVAGGQVINLINGIAQGGFSNSMFKTPVSFILGVFFLALLVGTATGFYPSKRAIKINPLDALRYE
jgi:putative ABC transport system permease protein